MEIFTFIEEKKKEKLNQISIYLELEPDVEILQKEDEVEEVGVTIIQVI